MGVCGGVGVTGTEPRVGLVLTGGGVRGLAHIGVLIALERMGLAPTAIVGVSMGSVVAASYAAREDWLGALGSVDRRLLPKFTDPGDADGIARLRTLVASARQMAPSVLTWGRQGVEEFGRSTMHELVGADSVLEDLAIPVAVCATDLEAGERVVFDSGNITEAVLSSCAIPGILAPRRRDGRLLVDGSFADPAPVDVARDMGADVVIAVDVGPTQGMDGGDSWATVMLRGLEIGHRRLVAERLSNADLVLRPVTAERVAMLNFTHADDVVRMGHGCTRAAIPELAELLDTTPQALAHAEPAHLERPQPAVAPAGATPLVAGDDNASHVALDGDGDDPDPEPVGQSRPTERVAEAARRVAGSLGGARRAQR